ncbi:hypothetical protein Catovirus_2_178 [Catovirus CTV1]|uniref:Uncharacterized protein n=1 Tax=Catovirus CTV1 TaxID=1977631 RepID=A0A1V0SC00_9VIRU|nr:hypothetical protein Catovirus_2_178 [Catovirus CTV1]
MTNAFSFEELEKLADKINKIRKKKYLEEIRDIIINNNPNIKITENSNGLFFHFHNLTDDTYSKINSFLKKINRAKRSLETSDILSSEHMPYSNEENPFAADSKLKYSNKEKNLIKRKNYDNELNGENGNPVDSQDNSNIFIKKSKNKN